MDTRWGTDGRSIVLVNNPQDAHPAPFATVTNLRETLNEIGGAIDREDDVVMIYLASPTAREQSDRGGAAAARRLSRWGRPA